MATLINGLDMPVGDAWSTAIGSGARANVSYASGRISTTGEPEESGSLRVKHRQETQQFAGARRPRGAVGKCPLRHPV